MEESVIFVNYRDTPVSYTHLDVYKRQFQDFPTLILIIEIFLKIKYLSSLETVVTVLNLKP